MKKIKILLIVILSIIFIGNIKNNVSAETYEQDSEEIIEMFTKFETICSNSFVEYSAERFYLTDSKGYTYHIFLGNGTISDLEGIYSLIYIINYNYNCYFKVRGSDGVTNYNGGLKGFISGTKIDESSYMSIIQHNELLCDIYLDLNVSMTEGSTEKSALPSTTFAEGYYSINSYNFNRNAISVILFIALILVILIPILYFKKKNKKEAKVKYNNIVVESTAYEVKEDDFNIDDDKFNVKDEKKENLKNNYYSRYREEDDDNE